MYPQQQQQQQQRLKANIQFANCNENNNRSASSKCWYNRDRSWHFPLASPSQRLTLQSG